MSSMDRVSVVGVSGSGKSTTARRMAELLGHPYLELDGLYHQPGWTPLPREEFQRRVSAFAAQDRWVIDGNYTSNVLFDAVWPRADAVVWIDMPRGLVLRRVVSRTLRRVASGEELWNGNRERWWFLLDPRPKNNVVAWSMATYGAYRRQYGAALASPDWSHLERTRLRSPGDVEAFLEGLRGRGESPP